MRVPRLYINDKIEIKSDLSLGKEASNYIGNVLRLGQGSKIILFNGDGYDYPSVVKDRQKRHLTIEVLERQQQETESPLSITLGLGMIKGERMDLSIQKAVELGVTHITPLFSDFSMVNLSGPRLEKKIQHWRNIVISACEQCERAVLPGIDPPIRLESWVTNESHKQAICLVMDPRSGRSLNHVSPHQNMRLHLLIGPEGGLSDAETYLATTHGFEAIQMGRRVLRAETAVIATLAAIQTKWGDFSS